MTIVPGAETLTLWRYVLLRKRRSAHGARRLPRFAAIYDGATRNQVANIGDVTLQMASDWGVSFNADRVRRVVGATLAARKEVFRCCSVHIPKRIPTLRKSRNHKERNKLLGQVFIQRAHYVGDDQFSGGADQIAHTVWKSAWNTSAFRDRALLAVMQPELTRMTQPRKTVR